MPFKSESQRRKFHSDPKLQKYVPEFEASTPPGSLPERVGPPRQKGSKRKRHKARKTALTAMLASGGNHHR